MTVMIIMTNKLKLCYYKATAIHFTISVIFDKCRRAYFGSEPIIWYLVSWLDSLPADTGLPTCRLAVAGANEDTFFI